MAACKLQAIQCWCLLANISASTKTKKTQQQMDEQYIYLLQVLEPVQFHSYVPSFSMHL